MEDFVFDGFDCKTDNSASTEIAEKGYFLDFGEGYDYSDSKCVKKAKKTAKKLKKQNKKIKKLYSKYKDLKKKLSEAEAEIEALKKSAYVSKIAALVNSDNVAERKRLASELYKMEV